MSGETPMPDVISSDLVVLEAAVPAAMAAAFLAADRGTSRPPSSTRCPNPAAPACISAASRPRRSCTRPTSSTPPMKPWPTSASSSAQPQIDLNKLRGQERQDRRDDDQQPARRRRARNAASRKSSAAARLSMPTQSRSRTASDYRSSSRSASSPSAPFPPSCADIRHQKSGASSISTSALQLESIPRKTMLVVGGGYIEGLEMGSVYASLGSIGHRRRTDAQLAAWRRCGFSAAVACSVAWPVRTRSISIRRSTKIEEVKDGIKAVL